MDVLERDEIWEIYGAAADFVAHEEGQQLRLGPRWYRLKDAVEAFNTAGDAVQASEATPKESVRGRLPKEKQ